MLFCASNATAQISLDAGLASDNNYRGISLNDDAPAASLNLAWDGDTGGYADAFASSVRFYGHATSGAQITADAGFARSTPSGLTWELGIIASVFPGSDKYDYSEIFAGLLGAHWDARLYFAPDYFGRNARTLYAEFNYTYPLAKHFRLFGHVGALQELAHQRFSSGTRRYDTALGAGVRLDRIDLQLRMVDTSHQDYWYPVTAAAARHEWVTSVTFSF